MSQWIEEKGYIPLVSPPTQTNAGSETILTFQQEILFLVVQNNTSVNVYISIDSTASPGSIAITPGTLLTYKKEAMLTVHLYTASAQNINGIVAGNIVVLGAV